MSESERSNLSKDESIRPLDSKFVQQTLPSYHPILNTTTVLPSLFIISAIFLPLGIGIWLFSENVGEVIIEYTNCTSIEDPTRSCDEVLHDSVNRRLDECTCLVNFTIPNEKMNKGSVYMYYYLTKHYYQNRKKYFNSKDENQLKGNIGSLDNPKKPSSRCGDFAEDSLNRTILPCGALANYMFSDSIELYNNNGTRDGIYSKEDSSKVPLIRTGIALESDRYSKYKNPDEFYKNPEKMRRTFGNPPESTNDTKFTSVELLAWKKTLWDLDPHNSSNNGLQNEDFIIWMRVSAFPDFKKLYRVVNTTEAPYGSGLPPGNYTLKISYNYIVTEYGGTKSIIFITTSIIGGQNHFLGIAYFAVGVVCLFLTIAFFLIHIYTRHKLKHCYNFSKNE